MNHYRHMIQLILQICLVWSFAKVTQYDHSNHWYKIYYHPCKWWNGWKSHVYCANNHKKDCARGQNGTHHQEHLIQDVQL